MLPQNWRRHEEDGEAVAAVGTHCQPEDEGETDEEEVEGWRERRTEAV
jgi:hypothetical protein